LIINISSPAGRSPALYLAFVVYHVVSLSGSHPDNGGRVACPCLRPVSLYVRSVSPPLACSLKSNGILWPLQLEMSLHAQG
jgi:hypothetical protein